MRRPLSLLALATACGTGDPPGTSDPAAAAADAAPGAAPCTRESRCAACGTCFEECRCSGGTAARCAEACAANRPPPDDGGAPAPSAARYPEHARAVTLVAERLEVGPGEEVFRCQDFANPFGVDVAMLGSESFMTAGSHHLFLFSGGSGVDSAMTPCSGLEFSPFVHLAQRPEETIRHPEGTGLLHAHGNGLRIAVHYLNTSDAVIHPEIAVTLHVVPPAAVAHLAAHVFTNTISLRLPPRARSVVRYSCALPEDSRIYMATSHMHRRGVNFVARGSDGQLLYTTSDWEEPSPWWFDPPRVLPGGSRVEIECTYDNDIDQSVGFGESAATSEMCIFAGLHYSAGPVAAPVTCLF